MAPVPVWKPDALPAAVLSAVARSHDLTRRVRDVPGPGRSEVELALFQPLDRGARHDLGRRGDPVTVRLSGEIPVLGEITADDALAERARGLLARDQDPSFDAPATVGQPAFLGSRGGHWPSLFLVALGRLAQQEPGAAIPNVDALRMPSADAGGLTPTVRGWRAQWLMQALCGGSSRMHTWARERGMIQPRRGREQIVELLRAGAEGHPIVALSRPRDARPDGVRRVDQVRSLARQTITGEPPPSIIGASAYVVAGYTEGAQGRSATVTLYDPVTGGSGQLPFGRFVRDFDALVAGTGPSRQATWGRSG